MTTMIESDTRGVDALSGESDDNVALLPALIFDELFVEMMGQLPIIPNLSFDDEPWRELPTIEDLQYLWLTSTPLHQLITAVAIKAHGDGEDLPKFMAQQWWMADMEVALMKGAADDRKAEDTDDIGRSGEAASVASAAAQRGGGDSAGGPENGDTVGSGEEVAKPANGGRSPKVSGGRRSRKPAGGSVDDAANDPPAAS